MKADEEVLVSVDIEASGQSPSVGSLLSIGACLVNDPTTSFYVELKPEPDKPWSDSAAQVHGLDRERLESEGIEPSVAMESLVAWLAEAADGRTPVFVGFNAPFDWMFVADYFWRYAGGNPFGISALDLKAYYMGRDGLPRWEETRWIHLAERLGLDPVREHNALGDARRQAALARLLLGLGKMGPG